MIAALSDQQAEQARRVDTLSKEVAFLRQALENKTTEPVDTPRRTLAFYPSEDSSAHPPQGHFDNST